MEPGAVEYDGRWQRVLSKMRTVKRRRFNQRCDESRLSRSISSLTYDHSHAMSISLFDWHVRSTNPFDCCTHAEHSSHLL